MADPKNSKLSYHDLVDYDTADPAKVLAQTEAAATAGNLPFGFSEVSASRGESAYVFDMGEAYGAFVQEGLGTKSLIAQSIYKETGKSHFAAIAKDTVATFINDLISVGATPVVSNAYWSSSSYAWLSDRQLTDDFIKGWRAACDEAGVVWGGGETQALSGIINEGVLELAGSAFGVIKPKNQLITEDKLQSGDVIILIEASGVHANGISLTREIAKQLPEGYQTQLKSGKSYGEALLAPTHIYAKVVRQLFADGVDIHYLSNITGHGWRKIMRATKEFKYVINDCPPVDEIFDFIAEHSGNDQQEMYGNYNMGAGYAVYINPDHVDIALKAIEASGLKAWTAGVVESGSKQLLIKPKNLSFDGDSLGVRRTKN